MESLLTTSHSDTCTALVACARGEVLNHDDMEAQEGLAIQRPSVIGRLLHSKSSKIVAKVTEAIKVFPLYAALTITEGSTEDLISRVHASCIATLKFHRASVKDLPSVTTLITRIALTRTCLAEQNELFSNVPLAIKEKILKAPFITDATVGKGLKDVVTNVAAGVDPSAIEASIKNRIKWLLLAHSLAEIRRSEGALAIFDSLSAEEQRAVDTLCAKAQDASQVNPDDSTHELSILLAKILTTRADGNYNVAAAKIPTASLFPTPLAAAAAPAT
ncbi:MAG: hypothetical protein JSR76_04675 [Verrucomicrobia bacterium]|nr:hypothetical protein [Verrucomicrobiota bacterium]